MTTAFAAAPTAVRSSQSVTSASENPARPVDTFGAGPRPSRRALWTGRTLSGIATLFLVFDAAMKVLQVPAAVQGTTELGYPASVLFGLGVVQLVCTALYVVPRTAVLGAVLWTGYLGGAIATHVRVGDPLFTHVLFPIYVALLLWGGLYLRNLRLRALFPLSER